MIVCASLCAVWVRCTNLIEASKSHHLNVTAPFLESDVTQLSRGCGAQEMDYTTAPYPGQYQGGWNPGPAVYFPPPEPTYEGPPSRGKSSVVEREFREMVLEGISQMQSKSRSLTRSKRSRAEKVQVTLCDCKAWGYLRSL